MVWLPVHLNNFAFKLCRSGAKSLTQLNDHLTVE